MLDAKALKNNKHYNLDMIFIYSWILFFCYSIIENAKDLFTFNFWSVFDAIEENSVLQQTPKPKYEDKYIDEQRRMENGVVSSDKLINNYVFENTPVGNVIMRYNHNLFGFEYYCDNAVPYTILEVVCRKYVITFKCNQLYIDMQNELKEYEAKLELERVEQERKQQIRKENAAARIAPNNKKVVFAKFKNYNTEAGTGRVNMGAPPKNSIPNVNTNPITNAILKERANRYLYLGKTSNFSILQKIDRKTVDKKLAMTFADFKRLNAMK
jgi:hypothetical protein